MVRKGEGYWECKIERRCEGVKTERSGTMRQDKLKSEFWGKTSFFFGVDTKVLNTNNK